jgi:hypothetical protein
MLVKLFGEVAALKQVVGGQREEIARLKGLEARPASSRAGWTKPPNRQSLIAMSLTADAGRFASASAVRLVC